MTLSDPPKALLRSAQPVIDEFQLKKFRPFFRKPDSPRAALSSIRHLQAKAEDLASNAHVVGIALKQSAAQPGARPSQYCCLIGWGKQHVDHNSLHVESSPLDIQVSLRNAASQPPRQRGEGVLQAAAWSHNAGPSGSGSR